MSITFFMHVIKAVHHLMEIGPCNFLGELSSFGNKIKKLTTSDIFQYNSKAIIGSLVLLLVDCILTDADKFDKIFMIQLLHDIEFVFEGIKGCGLLLILLDCH